jgi:integrase
MTTKLRAYQRSPKRNSTTGWQRVQTRRIFALLIKGFLAKIQILPWGRDEAQAYGRLRANQEAVGKIPEGHGHRLRDSFAVDLLQRVVSLETVSILVGHTSIRTTQKHYAPWAKVRQDAVEAVVKATCT